MSGGETLVWLAGIFFGLPVVGLTISSVVYSITQKSREGIEKENN